MSDDKRRLDSQKSRQELLDEIYLLRDVAGARAQQCASLRVELADTEQAIVDMKAELGRVYASRSWRVTSPLRKFLRWFSADHERTKQAAATSPAVGDDASPGVVTGVRPAVADASPDPVSSRRPDMRCLFVDVTELAIREGRTGVQRVVREILRALLSSPPGGFIVEPVSVRPGRPYCYTRAYATGMGDGDVSSVSAATIEVRSGDVFLGLDHSMSAVIENAEVFERMRAQGARVWFVCNDTLPLAHPEWFPPEVHGIFKKWFETIAKVSNGIACISRATENDVRHWVDVLNIRREQPLALGHFHLGADIGGDESRSALKLEEQADMDRLRDIPSFLMVGTLEPRKGHAQALQAFEQLWAQGEDVALVLVGLPGWMTEVTQRRIRHHDEFGVRLFWFMDASDATLQGLYASCTALLAPSEGEGFGLPLIEAARHGLPILCRDLPVFREVGGEHATYFSGRDAASLATAVHGWLEANQRGTVSTAGDIRWLTWNQSARGLLDVVLAARQSGE